MIYNIGKGGTGTKLISDIISEIQEAVQKAVRDINSTFWSIKGKLTGEQLSKLVKAKLLITSILEV